MFSSQTQKPQQRLAEVQQIPCPSLGIDTRQSIAKMNPENCHYTYNMMPSEYGMQIRFGYREWAYPVDDGSSMGVRTIIPFEGSEAGAADDRLFAVNNEGIWDVTAYNTAPVQKFVFGDQGADSGYGVKAHYVDNAGEEYLFYADSKNGLFQYQASTDAWIQATGITGVDVLKVAFIVVHKLRLWMLERDSTIGWYLPIESISGAATAFYFGAKFPHGGFLKGLYNWSVDGGAGVDDYLVAVSSSGDVIPYKGEDPSSPDTWSSVGSYFIGDTPKGRRVVNEYGGNLYLLSAYGIIAMSDLLRGVDVKDVAAASLSYKVARPLREQLSRTADQYGWDIQFVAAIGSLVIDTPQEVGFKQIQYVMSLTTSGWGFWRGVPMTCFEEFHGKVYFGDADSVIHVMDVYLDGILIVPPESVNNGSPIEFSLLQSYQTDGKPGLFKQMQLIRPDFWSVNEPNYQVKTLYDFSFIEQTLISQSPVGEGSVWDVGTWDDAIWGGSRDGSGWHDLLGASGIGRWMALSLRGECADFTRFLSWDFIFTSGGPI